MQFKIGDKVRRKPEHRNSDWGYGDNKFEIEGVDAYFIHLKELPSVWYPSKFELVKEDPTPKPVPFSLGDIVKTNNPDYDGTYKVAAIDDYTESVKVEGVNVWFKTDELEVVVIPVKTKEDELREFLENCKSDYYFSEYGQGYQEGVKYIIKNALEILNKK